MRNPYGSPEKDTEPARLHPPAHLPPAPPPPHPASRSLWSCEDHKEQLDGFVPGHLPERPSPRGQRLMGDLSQPGSPISREAPAFPARRSGRQPASPANPLRVAIAPQHQHRDLRLVQDL